MHGRRDEVVGLVTLAFGPPGGVGAGWTIESLSDAGGGRGVFSEVVRVTLGWDGDRGPSSVVVKLPASGGSDEAALVSGAYHREALAYRELVADAPVATPRAHAIHQDDDGRTSLVLEDLGTHRAVDQLAGLDVDDALSVAVALRRFHDHWVGSERLDQLPIRRSVPEQLSASALEAGLAALDHRWHTSLSAGQRAAFSRLVAARPTVARAFAEAGPPTLCHGDPRADNLVFAPDRRPVLFDWQQLAVQFGPADLAWLAATSLAQELRRSIDHRLVSAYGTSLEHYRLGIALPGLAVLLLAQRQLTDERSHRFVATSLTRIAEALTDLDPVAVAGS